MSMVNVFQLRSSKDNLGFIYIHISTCYLKSFLKSLCSTGLLHIHSCIKTVIG